MPASTRSRRAIGLPLVLAAAIVLCGTIGLTIHLASVLREATLAQGLIGTGLWRAVVRILGGKSAWHGDNVVAEFPQALLFLVIASGSLLAWLAGAAAISRRRGLPWPAALFLWGRAGWLWWLLAILWEVFGTAADLLDSTALHLFWQQTLPLCHSALWAGWFTTFFVLAATTAPASCEAGPAPRTPALVWGAMAVYFLCFSLMNCKLYESLLVPHGDSAMYEEHVWNLLHGKGFRSYLDNGRLFLGEHVQVVHLFVIPLYLLWPSHLLLELCQSACLALGAIPIFQMAHRHSRSKFAASLLAVAYLLYCPMQFLDIAVTFKTFRPNSFEIPFLLFALDALERRRYRTLLVWLGMTLLCQEDAAMIIAPLGVWIALRQARFENAKRVWPGRAPTRRALVRSEAPAGEDAQGAPTAAGPPESSPCLPVSLSPCLPRVVGTIAPRPGRSLAPLLRPTRLGWCLALFGVLYVVLAVKVVLPWFRGGDDVHFAQYFNDLGETSGEIVRNVVTHPGLLVGKLLNVNAALFALQLLAPLGFLPLLSPGRLAVGIPLFGVLCLSAITNSAWHHFHAPLVPILFWAAAAGLANATPAFDAAVAWWRHWRGDNSHADEDRRRIPVDKFVPSGKSLTAEPATSAAPAPLVPQRPSPRPHPLVVATAALWCFLNALFTGIPITLTPFGTAFWDPNSRYHWQRLYVPGERAHRFPEVFARIPRDSRVASTDYIHPRFTHHARSYDYSHYRPEVPDDCEFIVIDTQHLYSEIKFPEDVKEYRDAPDKWELLDDHTGGYFIVLKRRPSL